VSEAALPALPVLPEVASATVRGRLVYHPTREQYLVSCEALRDASFVTCSDLCGVDYLHHPGRDLPEVVVPERFEVVTHLLSYERAERVALRVQVPDSDPSCPSIAHLYPGAEAMEREAYDMFGVVFTGHPDMTRILMPEDWEGHPLRKDYSPGRVPVQFKEAPGPR
jgi:NADH-quinone oxidoreductase subunit C